MITLSELRPKIAEMADERFAPKSLCWINNDRDGEESDSYYCPECADKIIAWLIKGKYPKKVLENKYASHPKWKGLKKDDLYYSSAHGDYETDSCKHCELCGCQLQVTLLEYGIRSEIEHFETVKKFDSQDAWNWLDVIDGIDYVEEKWFQEDDEGDKAEAQKLYDRALAVTKRILGI